VGCVSGWVPWEDVSIALLALMVVSGAATFTTEIIRLWAWLYLARLKSEKPQIFGKCHHQWHLAKLIFSRLLLLNKACF
jgi:hypothetical protein